MRCSAVPSVDHSLSCPQVCNYTSTYKCSEDYQGGGGQAGGDPCAYSQDPCCRRATSFAACVLDSPAGDRCAYNGNGCQPDWGMCSRQVRSVRCRQMWAHIIA